jgi:predicted alpha/beta superfamily hydrolase
MPPAASADTLVFSSIGYTTLAVAVRGSSSTQSQRFFLKKKQVALAPVAITAPRLVERKFGIASQKALVHFTDGTMHPGEAFEIAQVLDTGQPHAQLTSVNLFLAASQPDSATVTIHFYGFDGSQPTQELGPPPPARRVAVRAGWLRLELPRQLPALPRVFVVGLEVAASPVSKPLPYEIKLGGNTQSFARTQKTAGWRVPPHHYRLYVTALVPSTAPVEDAAPPETPPTRYLYSAAVQDSFALYVQLPRGYRPGQHQTYPVVFLLDANVYFEAVRAQLAKLTKAAPVILVGIGYRDVGLLDSLRQRDYTYPLAAPADSFPVSGGGKQFLTFLTQELIPYVDRRYKTDPGRRALLGHSLGGYFALYALLEGLKVGKPVFTHYVAASPSLYYGDEYLRRQLATLPAAKESKALPALALYLTVGERELERGDPESLAVKAAFVAFTQELAARQLAALTWHRIVYPNAGHLETALPSFADGLKAFCKPR